MEPDRVRRVHVLGGGVMGGGIGQVLAMAGYEVLIRDLTPEVIDQTRHTIIETRFGLKRAVERNKLSAEDLDATIDRIRFTTDVADFAPVDLVIEAVPERLELKQAALAELDGIVKPGAIFTSNTSGLVIEEIGRDLTEDRRLLLVGMHFASPVPAMKMCEVVFTPLTSARTIETVRGLAESMGKVVTMVRDTPGTYGFVLNRVFAAARREADRIVADGIATREDVDKAMVNGRNWPVGFYGSSGVRTGWLEA